MSQLSEQSDIVIAGAGLISAAGATLDESWKALLAGFSIRTHSRAKFPVQPAESAGDRMIRLGASVARAAMRDAGWTNADARTALVVGTSKGPVDDWLTSANTPSTSDNPSNPKCEDVTSARSVPIIGVIPIAPAARANKRKCEDVTVAGSVAIESIATIERAADLMAIPSLVTSETFGLATIAQGLANALRIAGPVLTTSAACASSLHALIRAAIMLQHGEADRVIVVGIESSLHPAFIESFRRLGVLAPAGDVCRPFDRNRRGFLMSEAAAAICLERRRAIAGNVTLAKWAIGNDATHLTGTSPGAAALRASLERVIGGEPIDLIHAHGTGTPTNDAAELAAIEATLPPRRAGGATPLLFSHKAAIGHSLGASGLVAVTLNVQAHRRGTVPGNVNSIDLMTAERVGISREMNAGVIRNSVSVAAGFGGAIGVVRLTAN